MGFEVFVYFDSGIARRTERGWKLHMVPFSAILFKPVFEVDVFLLAFQFLGALLVVFIEEIVGLFDDLVQFG